MLTKLFFNETPQGASDEADKWLSENNYFPRSVKIMQKSDLTYVLLVEVNNNEP